jgi:hypothetical protein
MQKNCSWRPCDATIRCANRSPCGLYATVTGTQTRRQGRIQAGVVEKEVKFVFDTDEEVNVQIDAAYREKYRRYPDRIVNSVLTPAARSSTIELVPLSAT